MEVEEGEALPLRFAADILVAQLFIFRLDHGQVFLSDLQFGNVRDDGLDRKGIEALVGKKEHVLGKIEVLCRKRAAHIVVLVPADLHEVPDLIDDRVEAPLSGDRLPHGVVHFLSAVEGENDVFHLRIEKFHCVVV